MGFFRFFLASLVLASHMNITIFSLNPGVVAVVVFYLLAGQVVCRLWQRQADLAFGLRVRWFYRDRLWRILPMYGFVLVVACMAWSMGAESYFISAPPGHREWLNNLLIVPLNYYMFNGADTFTLLPPAWSLAAELQFYILVPFLLLRRWRVALAWLASLVVFLLAQSPALNTDVFGYRLLAGVGFVFIAGYWLETRTALRQMSLYHITLLVLWLGIGLYVAMLVMYPTGRQPYNLEVSLGFFIGLPAVVLLSRWKPKGRLNRAQRLAGVLSYGVFLAHFPVIWLLELWLPVFSDSVVAVLLGSTLIAICGHLVVERPLWARYRPELKRKPVGIISG